MPVQLALKILFSQVRTHHPIVKSEEGMKLSEMSTWTIVTVARQAPRPLFCIQIVKTLLLGLLCKFAGARAHVGLPSWAFLGGEFRRGVGPESRPSAGRDQSIPTRAEAFIYKHQIQTLDQGSREYSFSKHTMRVTAAERQRSGNILGVKKDSRSCIMKAATATSIEHAGLSEEMNDCLLQLSGMVPHVPRNEKGNIEAAVLIQYVIDYILDLSQQLGGQYPFLARTPSLQCMGESREPLSEKSLENIVSCQSPQSPSHSSSSVSSSPEFDIRPPSK
ncbi:DNA-binding protein inhibitor id-2 [Plakobranchus ocellatus]|uniref:DNA-binding protein inhibitor id-2 n=1 Tax=Plakobranchus ocellatus TaxID=259542 RepID=A0AAV3YXJ1_9GAST|nr:DNA-binding protein inhibitor id-2 [Plakobranchus ocellatus]